MFIPLIFACTIATPVAPTICESVPEKIQSSRFQHAAECLAFAHDQAPKVVDMFAGRPVYITTRCAEVIETCRPDTTIDHDAFPSEAKAIRWRIDPYVGGGPACRPAVERRA